MHLKSYYIQATVNKNGLETLVHECWSFKPEKRAGYPTGPPNLMNEDIINLRERGFSYKQICQILGCSKGTVAYHLGENQKEKHRQRVKNRRKNEPFKVKIERFRHRVNTKPRTKKAEAGFYQKCIKFRKRTGNPEYFSVDDVLNKFGEQPTCYLTGQPIDLKDTSMYSFDHIIPICRGGSNTLDNLGLVLRTANEAKGKLLITEFLDLCEQILKYHKRI